MRFPILQHTSERLLRNAAIVLIAGLGAGCSADTMRFTDGLYTGSTTNQRVVQSNNNMYSPGPVAAAQPISSGTVQRHTLPPASSAPIAAATSPVQNAAVERVNDTANRAQTQVASAATAASSAASNARENVLGQLPATANGVPLPNSNTAAAPTPAPAIDKPQPQTAASGGAYMVKSGDSLFSIAQKHNVSVDELKRANGLSSGAIRVGQSLAIPSGAGATTQVAAATIQPQKPAVAENVKPASTPPNAADVKPYTPPQASNKVIEEAEKDQAKAPSSSGITQMRWPVRGRILTSFGQRDGSTVNDGIDIMVPEGTSVKAAENGVVIYAGDGLKEFGQTVLIRHDNGLVTVYGHNSEILVQRGQKVRRGEDIAKSGMSGNAKAPKLHFEVRKDSSPVNPAKYLES